MVLVVIVLVAVSGSGLQAHVMAAHPFFFHGTQGVKANERTKTVMLNSLSTYAVTSIGRPSAP